LKDPGNNSGRVTDPTPVRISPGDALPAGFILADYEIGGVADRSRFGFDYFARDRLLGIPVVVKEFFPPGQARRASGHEVIPFAAAAFDADKMRYLREAQSLARYKHEAIVRVFRVFEALGTVYGVYEHIEGKTLSDWSRDRPSPISQADLDMIVTPLLDALESLHQDRFLHRDIGPDTIMIRKGTSKPVLVGFSSGKREQVEISAAVMPPKHAAPEIGDSSQHLQGPWTDIYSLAAVLHQLVTGQAPAAAPDRMLSGESEPPLMQRVPSGIYRPSFLTAIDKALQIQPAIRPQSVADWRPALVPRLTEASTAENRAVGTKVFVSYRRADTAHLAGRIFDHLEDAFGRDEVFFDIEAIPPGVDFRAHIDARIRQSAVVLAVIGPNWLRRPSMLGRLLGRGSGPDHVTLEIGLAMQHGVPILPMLVDGAGMPSERDLPASIAALSSINALPLRGGGDFRSDMAKVLAVAKAHKSGNG
jgi:serine/threonine protein kinase